ncbi:MAG: FAD-binding oxidoreductase [Comamonadaceae bacterium]|nr:FAD-binding oxidoreductase [Comamonadaceae bacterium]
MPDVTPLTLRVAHARQLSPLIRLLCLQAQDGAALPGYTPGAHIQVRVRLADGREDWRHYSLIELTGQEQARKTPASYTIAVRLEEAGRGGSRFMHEGLQEGSVVQALPPRNDFPMHDGAHGAVLAAGGIGVTPLASMAAARRAAGQPVRMVYAGRQRSQMAFLDELQALLGDALEVHADDERGAALDAQALVSVPGGFGKSSQYLMMNERKWQSLSEADRAAIEKVSGEVIARNFGSKWQTGEVAAQQRLAQAGLKTLRIEGQDLQQLQDKLAFVEKDWLAAAAKKNIDGPAVLAYFREQIKTLSDQ